MVPLDVTPSDDTDATDSDSSATSDGDGSNLGSEGAVTPTSVPVGDDRAAEQIPAVAETGVPGIDSDNAFCRAWSQFAGSFQALTLVSAIGDPAQAMQLKVIASSAVVEAVANLGVQLPNELQAEKVSLVEQFAGPFAKRAMKAQVALMIDVWLTQLAVSDVDDPALTAVLPPHVDALVIDSAVAAFVAAVPAIVQDSSLITTAQTPLTEQYLVTNCPDRGTLSGNDVVG